MTEKERELYYENMNKARREKIDAALPFKEVLRNGDFNLIKSKNDECDDDDGDVFDDDDDFEIIKAKGQTFIFDKSEKDHGKLYLNSQSADGKTKVYYNDNSGYCQNFIYNEETKDLRYFNVYEGEGSVVYWEAKNIFTFYGHEEIVQVAGDTLEKLSFHTR